MKAEKTAGEQSCFSSFLNLPCVPLPLLPGGLPLCHGDGRQLPKEENKPEPGWTTAKGQDEIPASSEQSD